MTILASLEFVEDCIQLYALEGCPDPGVPDRCRTLKLCNLLYESIKGELQSPTCQVPSTAAILVALSYQLPIRHCVLHREHSVLFLPEARDLWNKLDRGQRLPNTYSELISNLIEDMGFSLHYTSFVEV